MKKLLFSLLLVAAVCACTEKPDGPTEPQDGKVGISANVTGPVAFAEGDKFFAMLDSTSVVTFTLKEGAGTTSAVFAARVEPATEETEWQWKAVLGSKAAPQAIGIELEGAYIGQDGTEASAAACNYIVATAEGEAPEFNFASGEQLSATLKVKLPAGVKSIEYTTCLNHRVTPYRTEEVYLEPENDFSTIKTSVINLAAASSAGDFVYIAVPAVDHSYSLQILGEDSAQDANLRTGVVLTLMNEKSNDATLSNGVVFSEDLVGQGGSTANVDLSDMTLIARPRPSDAIQLETSNVSFSYTNGGTFMQAASKVNAYWAPFNIGATTAGEIGNRFAFGEIFDNGVYTEEAYTMKHNASGYFDIMINTRPVIVDNENNAEYYSLASSRYDAARVLWGSAWRMPHIIDVQALIAGTCATEQVGGTTCTKFTDGAAPIYIPACGKRVGGDVVDGSYGYIRPADHFTRSHTNAAYNQALTPWIKAGDLGIGRDAKNIDGVPIRPVLNTTSYE